MIYDAYLRHTSRAASAVGGRVTSLAGGYFGATFPADGCHVVLCIDYDAPEGACPWVAWREDDDGERCCDRGAVLLGIYRPVQYGLLREHALRSLLAHTCGETIEAA